MATGPGKYDNLCTYVREQAKADGSIIVVINGEHGGGFSVQADMATQRRLPDILEGIARQIRADLEVEETTSPTPTGGYQLHGNTHLDDGRAARWVFQWGEATTSPGRTTVTYPLMMQTIDAHNAAINGKKVEPATDPTTTEMEFDTRAGDAIQWVVTGKVLA